MSIDDDPFAPATAPSPEPASADADTSEGGSKRRGVTAAGGSKMSIPPQKPIPAFPGPSQDELYIPPPDVSYDDIVSLNREIARLRSALYRVNQSVTIAQQKAAAAELAYQQAYNRAMATLSGGSEKTRQASAELMCEELETERKIAQIVYDRQKRLSMTVRNDLDMLANIGHNLRTQLAVTHVPG